MSHATKRDLALELPSKSMCESKPWKFGYLLLSFALQWGAFALLVSVLYGGELPYTANKGVADPSLTAVEQSKLFFAEEELDDQRSTWWHNSHWQNSFYVAGRNDGVLLKTGKLLSYVVTPLTGMTPLYFGWDYAAASDTLIYDTDDNSKDFGRKSQAFAHLRPAYGKLQAFAQQFTHIEELAERQAGLACGEARAFALNTSTLGPQTYSTVAGGSYCDFLETRAATVRLWFRTIVNTWHMAVWALTLLLFIYVTRFVAGVLFGYLARDELPNLFTHIHKAYVMTSHTGETIMFENILLKAILVCVIIVRFLLADRIVATVADGPDTMGYLAAKDAGQYFISENIDPVTNFYDDLPGMQRGRVFFSATMLREAQSTATFAIAAWVIMFLVRATFYFNHHTFYNASSKQKNEKLAAVFGFLVPSGWKNLDPANGRDFEAKKRVADRTPSELEHDKTESVHLPTTVLCFFCCYPCDHSPSVCCKPIATCSKACCANNAKRQCHTDSCFNAANLFTLWWLRGNTRYTVFVFVTFVWLLLICFLYAPVFYIDGLRSETYLKWDAPWASAKCALSLFGSMPENGGYGTAAVLGTPPHALRWQTSPRRQAYQDFTHDTNKNANQFDSVYLGMTYGMFADFDVTDWNFLNLDSRTCAMCIDFSYSDVDAANNRIASGGTAKNMRAIMQEYGPDVLGSSALLRYQAMNSEAFVTTGLFFTLTGAYVILFSVVLIYMLRAKLTWKHVGKDHTGWDLRGYAFALLQFVEYTGQAFVMGAAIMICFFAVPMGENVRDSLANMGSNGIGLRQSTTPVADKLSVQYLLANNASAYQPGNRMSDFVNNNQLCKFGAALDGHRPWGICDFHDTHAKYEMAGGIDTNTGLVATDFMQKTGATTFQRAIGLALTSTNCLLPTSDTEKLPRADCNLGTRSFFRDETFLFAGNQAMTHNNIRTMRTLVDANLRPVARSATSYFFDSNPSAVVPAYGVDDEAIVTPGFENDIRVVTIIVVMLCVVHIIAFEVLFVPMYSTNHHRQAADALRKETSTADANPLVEMQPLLPYQARTTLRMTGLPAAKIQ